LNVFYEYAGGISAKPGIIARAFGKEVFQKYVYVLSEKHEQNATALFANKR